MIDTVGHYWWLIAIGQFALAIGIQGAINRISPTASLGLFFIYAASMGFTIAFIVSYYTSESVASAFFSAAAMFGAAAVYGAVTKRELAGMGGLLFMALIGLFVAMIVNIFLASSAIGWVISIIGVVLFSVTAYDVQRIHAATTRRARARWSAPRSSRRSTVPRTSSTCSVPARIRRRAELAGRLARPSRDRENPLTRRASTRRISDESRPRRAPRGRPGQRVANA